MVRIHSFYNDLLLYMRYLFDNVILGPGTIKHYEFNTGNRTLQLDYQTQYGLPLAIISLQNPNPILHHPWLANRSRLDNHSLFPVIYNKTKRLRIELQEEEFEIPINITINCESQYSALQIQHRLLTDLPIGKPKELKFFYSFLEIPEKFLDPEILDVNKDDIINLYMRHDYLTDKSIYCTSVRYEPLVKMDSCQVGLSNTEPRSFPVECSFLLHTGVPMYFQIPFDEHPTMRHGEELIERQIIVPLEDTYPIMQFDLKDRLNNSKTIAFPILQNEFNQDILLDDNSELTVSGKVSFVKEHGNAILYFQGEDLHNTYDKITNINAQVHKFLISGPLNGQFIEYNEEGDQICGHFSGEYHSKKYSEEIKGQLEKVSKSWLLDDFEYKCSSNKYRVIGYNILTAGELDDAIIGLNTKKVQFIPEKSLINGLQIFESDTKHTHNIKLEIPIKINKYGSFTLPLEYISTKSNTKQYITISGNINPSTQKILIKDIISEQELINQPTILSLNLTLYFKNIPKYGEKLIENINFDLTPQDFNPISVGSNISFFKDNLDRIQESRSKILKTFIIYPSLDPSIFIIEKDHIKLKLELDYSYNYYNLIQQPNITYKFIYNNQFFHKTNEIIVLDDQALHLFPNLLYFKISKINFDKYLKDYSLSNPIFFQIQEMF